MFGPNTHHGLIGDNFGATVSLSATGSAALVGGIGNFGQIGPIPATESFFVRSGARWSRVTTVLEPFPLTTDGGAGGFGHGVLSSDASTAILSWNNQAGSQTLATYVHSGAHWVRSGPILTDPTGAGYAASSISGNGRTAVVSGGLQRATHPPTGIVTILARSGSSWKPVTRIATQGVNGGVYYRVATALSGTGRTLLVARLNQSATVSAGAWVYQLGSGKWTRTKTLAGPVPHPNIGGTGYTVGGSSLRGDYRRRNSGSCREPGGGGSDRDLRIGPRVTVPRRHDRAEAHPWFTPAWFRRHWPLMAGF